MPKENNKEKALTALLNAPSIAEAAKSCGLSEKTLRRYLAEPDFRKEYREARRLFFEEEMLQLRRFHAEAVETITRNLHCENPAVEVRAAQIVLEQTRKDFETFDVLERLENLEDGLEKKN
jgi:DNA-binding transcriptional MerR regulator